MPVSVPSIVTSLNRRTIAQCTHGEQVRDYLHVVDAAEACVAVLDTDVQGPINIASGQPVRLRDLAGYIARRFKADNLLRMGALHPPIDDPPLLGDGRKRNQELLELPPREFLEGRARTQFVEEVNNAAQVVVQKLVMNALVGNQALAALIRRHRFRVDH